MTDIVNVIEQCGQFLKTACIRRMGTISLVATNADTISWRSPCLRPNLSLGPVEFDPLVPLIYGPISVTDQSLEQMWEEISVNHTQKDWASFERKLEYRIPEIDWGPAPRVDPRYRLVQILLASSWSRPAALKATSRYTVLKLARGFLRVDTAGLEWGGKRRRFRTPIRGLMTAAYTEPLGHRNAGHPVTTALFRWLLGHFPELHRELNWIFAAAVSLNRDAEKALTDPFDIDFVAGVSKPRHTVWTKCLEIINSATSHPVKELSQILSERLTSQVVWDLFGSDINVPYSNKRREFHRSVIVKLQNEELASIKGTPDQSAINNLLALQELIRG